MHTSVKATATAFALLGLTYGAIRPAVAQSIQLDTTTISLVRVQSGSATSDWASVAGNPKIANMVAFAQQQLGTRLTPDTRKGFTTRSRVRYSRGGVNSDMDARITIIPLTGTSRSGGSAALMIGKYDSTPSLVIPRLLLRRNPSDPHAEEYAFRLDNRVTLMTANFGDCLFRSSLKILEQKNAPAHNALRATLTNTARPGIALSEGLRAVYDVRSAPVAQPELVLISTLMTSANVEEEYAAGYISGTLEQSFKPDRRDSFIKKQIKELAKSVLSELRKSIASALRKALLAYFGL